MSYLWIIIFSLSYIVVSIIIGAFVSATVDERLGDNVFLLLVVILFFGFILIFNC